MFVFLWHICHAVISAQIWQVHASAALNLCRVSWVSMTHFTWNFSRHATQTITLRNWARHLLHSGHFLTVVARGGSAGVVGSVLGWSVERRCKGIEICWGNREHGWLLTAMFVWQKKVLLGWDRVICEGWMVEPFVLPQARKRNPRDSFVDLESGRCSTHGRDAGIWCRWLDGIQRGWYRCTRSRRAPGSPRRPPPEGEVAGDAGRVGSSGRRKGGSCASHSASWVCWAGFEDLRPKAASPRATSREGSGSLSPYIVLAYLMLLYLMLFVCVMLLFFAIDFCKCFLFSWFVLVYWNIVCLFHVLICFMHSAFNLLVFHNSMFTPLLLIFLLKGLCALRRNST